MWDWEIQILDGHKKKWSTTGYSYLKKVKKQLVTFLEPKTPSYAPSGAAGRKMNEEEGLYLPCKDEKVKFTQS